MPTCKTWKQRSCRAWNPISRVLLRLDLKGQLSLSTGCRFTTFSKRRRRSWWILSSWAHTAVPASNTCSWAAWQKKSYVWRHAQCSSRASLPLCQYRKGRRGSHLLLGSVAEKVVRLAPCPVLTVRYSRHEVE